MVKEANSPRSISSRPPQHLFAHNVCQKNEQQVSNQSNEQQFSNRTYDELTVMLFFAIPRVHLVL
jgi:hypothetical protein